MNVIVRTTCQTILKKKNIHDASDSSSITVIYFRELYMLPQVPLPGLKCCLKDSLSCLVASPASPASPASAPANDIPWVFWLAGRNKKARSSKKGRVEVIWNFWEFQGFLLRGCWWNPCIKHGCDRNFKDFFHDDSQTSTYLCLVRAQRTFKGNSTSKSPEDVQDMWPFPGG